MSSELPAESEHSGTPTIWPREGTHTASKVAKLLHRIAADEIEKYDHSRLFPFPFYIDEKFLCKVRDAAITHLSAVPVTSVTEFKSETRFQDLSTVRFDVFEDFISKAGDRKDPESCVLRWSRFALDENGKPIAGEVQFTFVTEKRLHTQDNAPGEFNHAYIKLTVSGSSQTWVENTFADLVPYVETSKLGGIYRPLWLFRNKWFISIFSQALSWMGFIIGMVTTMRLFRRTVRLTEAEVLKNILTETNMLTKFDLLAKQLLTPSTTPWWEPIVTITAGGITYAMLFIGGMSLLPKLTPNSSIAIGLSDRRAQSYMNVFKFIVFTVLLCGIILPLLVELIKLLF